MAFELCHEERHSLVKSIGASKTSVGFLGKPSPSILLSLSLQRLANSPIQWLNLHAFYDPFFTSYWIKWTVLKSFGVPMFRNNKEFGRDPSAIGLVLLYNEESVSFHSLVECLASCLLQPCTDPGDLSTAFTHHCYFLMNTPTHSIRGNHGLEVIWGSSLPSRNHGFALLKGPPVEFCLLEFPRECLLVVFTPWVCYFMAMLSSPLHKCSIFLHHSLHL